MSLFRSKYARPCSGLEALVLSLSLASLAGLAFPLPAHACPTCTSLPHYTAHEWGTFTTLSDSKGNSLAGLYLDDEKLPAFVYTLPFYHPPESEPYPNPTALAGVTTKMETPVIYFYSDSGFQAQAEVDFRGGAITQWYPKRISGDTNPAPDGIDFKKDAGNRLGKIRWEFQVLPKGSAAAPSPTGLTGDWNIMRSTESNLIQASSGEIEKFLFYRGLGHLSLPLKLSMPSRDTLRLANDGGYDLAYVLVLDLLSGDPNPVWWQGPLAAGSEITLSKPATVVLPLPEAIKGFVDALVHAGLNQLEAVTMLQKWNIHYFNHPGFKVFWIVPRALTDSILPLRLNPAPDELARVLVGRSEVLPPDFESVLRQAQTSGTVATYQGDRRYLAYLDYLDHVESQSASFIFRAPYHRRTRGENGLGSAIHPGYRGKFWNGLGRMTSPQ